MNITLDKKNRTEGLLKVSLSEPDYQPNVGKKIKEYASKANLKGFRQGKVPRGIIKKMYGKSILVEEVNNLVAHSLSEYIRDNKIKILGEPIPNQEKAGLVDWDTQKEFEFEFQIGIIDEFTCTLSPKMKFKSHSIEVDDTAINETLLDVKERFGTVSSPEISKKGDRLHGVLTAEADQKTQTVELQIDSLKEKEQQKFLDKKVGEEITFNLEDVFESPDQASQFLGMPPEKSEKGKYTLNVSSISRLVPAEINQELFDKVFGKNSVASEEEFISKIKETISKNYSQETERLLENQVQQYLVEHIKIHIPEEFLKAWIKNHSKGNSTDKELETELTEHKKQIKWDLIKNKIAEDFNIQVEEEEVKSRAKNLIINQYGGEALREQLGDKLDGIATNYLSGEQGKNFKMIHNQLKNEKIMKVIKETITITEKTVKLEGFKKIVSDQGF